MIAKALKHSVQSGRKLTATVRTYSRPLARAYFAARNLKLRSDNTSRIRNGDIILVSCQRNEQPRLPYFFDYYRRLGIGHFLFIDNDSDDGSREWLCSQPDASVWHTTASYRDSNFGIDWCNALLRRYGTERWCLTVDPDEFLVFPRMETRSLHALCRFLDDEERRSLQVLMLDAYSDRPLSRTEYRAGENPFEVCAFFDRDGYIQDEGFGRATWIRGGPRLRVYYADQPGAAPALNKTPLVKWRPHYHYRSSMHDLRPFYLNKAQAKLGSPTTGCLFHFKFLSSLKSKASEELVRQQHYDNSAEYRRYQSSGDVSLMCEGISTRYASTDQLVELGLMNQGRWF